MPEGRRVVVVVVPARLACRWGVISERRRGVAVPARIPVKGGVLSESLLLEGQPWRGRDRSPRTRT